MLTEETKEEFIPEKYEGEQLNKQRNGRGQFTYNLGTYIYPNGIYAGNWKANKADGKGKPNVYLQELPITITETNMMGNG